MRGEFAFLSALRSRLAGQLADSVVLGVGDDAAVLKLAGQVVLAKDLLIEQVHFRRDWSSAEDIGWKALAVNLSDLAAMGARPTAFLLGLALPKATDESWLFALLEGMLALADEYGVALVGGDTTASPGSLMLSVTAVGEATRILPRHSPYPGDQLWLSRAVGGAAAGLEHLLGHLPGIPAAALKSALLCHRRPLPEVALGMTLATIPGVSACIDVSDGLSQDLLHLLEKDASLGVRLHWAQVPLHPALHGLPAAEQWRLANGGEDYALLFTASPESAAAVRALPGNPQHIGEITGDGRRLLVAPDGRESILEPLGYDHFA